MNSLSDLTPSALRRAADLQEKILALQNELKGILGAPVAATAAAPSPKGKRRLSAAGKARIIAATKARWAKFHLAKAGAGPAKPRTAPKKKMPAAAKMKLAQIAKARWAKARAAGKSRL